MICSVFKPKRQVKGKSVAQRLYFGQYRLDGQTQVTRVPLTTPDRQVAEKRLRKIVAMKQQEAEGLIPSASIRQASEMPLNELAEQFLADLDARGNTRLHVYDTGRYLRILMAECGWGRAVDINAMAFEQWRSKHGKKSPKTLNMHLAAARNFANWMCQRGMLASDPLQVVEKVKMNGRQFRVRRAFTEGEMRALLAVADWRGPLYLAAYHTGLRRSELQALVWGDLHLDDPVPFVVVRASTSKNRKQATLPLHRDVVAVLRSLRPAEAQEDTTVFRYLHRMKAFKRDLVAAKIPYRDAQGRYLDFHSFRHTTATNLALAGVGMRTSMELMRHSDARLTNKVYTDTTLLRTAESMGQVPSVLDASAPAYAQLHAQKLVPGGLSESAGVATAPGAERAEPLENKGFKPAEASSVAAGQNGGTGGRYWIRTSDLLHVRQAL